MKKLISFIIIILSIKGLAQNTNQPDEAGIHSKKTLHCKTSYYDYIIRSKSDRTEIEFIGTEPKYNERVGQYVESKNLNPNSNGYIYRILISMPPNSCNFLESEPFVAECLSIDSENIRMALQMKTESETIGMPVNSVNLAFKRTTEVDFGGLERKIWIELKIYLNKTRSAKSKSISYINRIFLDHPTQSCFVKY